VKRIWPAGVDSVVVLIEKTLYLIVTTFNVAEQKATATFSLLLHLPERLLEFDISFRPKSGLTLVGFQLPLVSRLIFFLFVVGSGGGDVCFMMTFSLL
jgi:hypothetical protein